MATNILHDSILMRSDLIVFSVGGRAGVRKGASGGEIGVNEKFFAAFSAGLLALLACLR